MSQIGQLLSARTLRFGSAQLEDSFLLARRPLLLSRARALLLLALGALLVRLSLLLAQGWPETRLRAAEAAGFAGLVGLLLLAFLALLGEPLLRRVPTGALEALLEVVVLSVAATAALLSGPRRLCKLVEEDDSVCGEVEAAASDALPLLLLDLALTAAHGWLPLRWVSLLLFEAAVVGSYGALVGFLGSCEPPASVFANLGALAALALLAGAGRRASEAEERAAFAEEGDRCSRSTVSFEFCSEGGGVANRTSSVNERVSQMGSLASHTESAGVFESFYEKENDTAAQLRYVAALAGTEHWRIERGEVTFLQDTLGRGGFGTVQKAIFAGILVAVKRPRVDKLDLDATKVSDICNEIRVLRHLRHPNIVTTHGAVIVPQERQLFLVLELLDGVTLTSFLVPRAAKGDKVPPPPPPSTLARYQVMLGICRALLYMHTRYPSIVHGDLKSSNVMVEVSKGHAHPKLLDFGLSRVLSRKTRALGGTLAWMAPEVVEKAAVRCSADIYSMGHLLAFTATSTPPMKDLQRQRIVRLLKEKRPPLPSWPEGCAFRHCLSPLVNSCLQANEDLRPGVAEVYEALLRLPDRLGLNGESTVFLENVQLVATRLYGEQAAPTCLSLSEEPLSPSQECGSVGQLPSLPEGEELLSPAATEGSASQTLNLTRVRRMPYPQLPETSRSAMLATLNGAFMRWNAPRPKVMCCERHAWLRICKDLCHEGLASRCIMGHLKHTEARAQCRSCGILGVEVVCDLCGEDQSSTPDDSLASALSVTEVDKVSL